MTESPARSLTPSSPARYCCFCAFSAHIFHIEELWPLLLLLLFFSLRPAVRPGSNTSCCSSSSSSTPTVNKKKHIKETSKNHHRRSSSPIEDTRRIRTEFASWGECCCCGISEDRCAARSISIEVSADQQQLPGSLAVEFRFAWSAQHFFSGERSRAVSLGHRRVISTSDDSGPLPVLGRARALAFVRSRCSGEVLGVVQCLHTLAQVWRKNHQTGGVGTSSVGTVSHYRRSRRRSSGEVVCKCTIVKWDKFTSHDEVSSLTSLVWRVSSAGSCATSQYYRFVSLAVLWKVTGVQVSVCGHTLREGASEREREREFVMRCEEEWRRNDEQLLSASFCCEQKVCRRRYGLSDERPRRKNERRKCVHCLKNGEQRMIRIVLWMKPETGQYVITVNWRSSKKVDRKEETKIVSCLLTVTAWLWERREISCNLRFPVFGQSCSQDHEKEG